jgi:citrate lyase subunit beta/citryl-CoA lyase
MDQAGRKSRLLGARTFLFVPGDQPERILKALQAKTDAVIIDLEDSVKSESKVAARAGIVTQLTENRSATGPLVLIRTNEAKSAEFLDDLKTALDLQVDAIVLPKFISGESAVNVDLVISKVESELNQLHPMPVIGLVESTSGVLNLLNLSFIPDRVVRLALGAADLYADLGVTYKATGPNTDLAMAALVLASAHAKLGAPIDSPHFAVVDKDGLRERAIFANEIGFGGKLCIHPDQLAIVAESFKASADEKDWAVRVIERWNARDQKSGVLLLDGSLVDEAMVKRAKQILGLL